MVDLLPVFRAVHMLIQCVQAPELSMTHVTFVPIPIPGRRCGCSISWSGGRMREKPLRDYMVRVDTSNLL
jgi:hypothetical protein